MASVLVDGFCHKTKFLVSTKNEREVVQEGTQPSPGFLTGHWVIVVAEKNDSTRSHFHLERDVLVEKRADEQTKYEYEYIMKNGIFWSLECFK